MTVETIKQIVCDKCGEIRIISSGQNIAEQVRLCGWIIKGGKMGKKISGHDLCQSCREDIHHVGDENIDNAELIEQIKSLPLDQCLDVLFSFCHGCGVFEGDGDCHCMNDD